ncbi:MULTISPECIES: hypothetical protein [Methylobacteriaceae]|uniref:hypothetical protein n=1 Tax=Methylobacteriaceae TaxID=119045 RepID=UPI002F35916B
MLALSCAGSALFAAPFAHAQQTAAPFAAAPAGVETTLDEISVCSFMSAEYANLPEAVQREAQGFADVNVAWLAKVLVKPEDGEARARAIFAAVSGAQLYARSRSDVSQFDALIEGYRASGLLPP